MEKRTSLTGFRTNISSYHYVSPDGNSAWKGPRKVCWFCSLAIVFPALLISVPLFMRFVLYGSSQHFLSASDMKVLDTKISTTWCQGETIRMNTTFTAYVTDGEPSVIESPTNLTIEKTLIIPDDHKEFWGFYLLKGSRFRIRTCSRWRGGTLLVVHGENHLQHCAYIGEADSAGDSDQISSSNSIEHLNNRTYSQEELSEILTGIRHHIKSNPKNHGRLKEMLATWLMNDQKDLHHIGNKTVHIDDISKELQSLLEIHNQTQSESKETTVFENVVRANLAQTLHENSVDTGIIRRSRRQSNSDIRRNTESGENGAFEDETIAKDEGDKEVILENVGLLHPRMKYLAKNGHHLNATAQQPTNSPSSSLSPSSVPSSIWVNEHGHHTGVLNETKRDEEGSDSESESSFSSSEEALLKCEGVLATFNIIPDENCDADGSFETLEVYSNGEALRISSYDINAHPALPYYEDVVNASGYYYFIFGSENEKRDNFIRAKFELEKVEYKLPAPVHNCTNVKECRVEFSFASSQKIVAKIPRPPVSIGHHWDQVYLAETECQPRAHLYMIFALMVPLVILLCAFQ